MMPKGPKIEFISSVSCEWSTVVPVHRRRDGLKRCLESVADQMRDDHELIVVDHTEDKVARDICKEVIGKVKYQHVNPTGGMASDWNFALSYASGRWIHLLHDDDFLEHGYYENLSWKRPLSALWAATGFRNQCGIKETFRQMAMPAPLWPSIAISNPLQPVAVSVSRQAYIDYGGYNPDPQLRHCPDWELYCRLAEAGHVLHFHPEPLAVHMEGGKDCESASPWIEIIDSYRSLHERMYFYGVQRDALVAGCGLMLNLAIRKALDAALKLPEETFWAGFETNTPDWVPLWELAIDLRRQQERYIPK